MTLSDKITRAILGGAVLTTLGAGCKEEAAPSPPMSVVPEQEVGKPTAAPTATTTQVAVEPEAAPAPPRPVPPPVALKPVKPPPVCASGVAGGYNSEMLSKGGSYKTCAPAKSGCTASTFSSEPGRVVCGPWESGDACCAVMAIGGKPTVKPKPPLPKPKLIDPLDPRDFPDTRPMRGRPFVVQGEVRTAEVRCSSGWTSSMTFASDELTPEERMWFASEWSRAGAEEHASIASFSQFLLDLMALGAPPELIVGTTRAIEDEVRHAQQCFGLASHFAGEPLGPGVIDTTGAKAERDEADILRAAIAEGCIGETVAAFAAEWAAPHAADQDVAEVLRGIATDEGDHAALAWRFVSWMLATRPHLHDVAHDAFAEVLLAPAEEGVLPQSDGIAFGVLTPELDAALQSRALSTVVRPAAQRLLSDVS